jgi:dCTP deaminase
VRTHIPPEGFLLRPGRIYLGSTLEIIGSDTYVPSLIGRSSLGRLGLFLQITADLGHLGTKHCWTLELKTVQPLIIYAGMRIGQVSFWKPEGLELLQGARYLHQLHSYAQFSGPQPSLFHKLLDDVE